MRVVIAVLISLGLGVLGLVSPGSELFAQTATPTAPATATPSGTVQATPIPPTQVVIPASVYSTPGTIFAHFRLSPTVCGQTVVTGTSDAVIQLSGDCQGPGTLVSIRNAVGTVVATAVTPANGAGGRVVASVPEPPATGNAGTLDSDGNSPLLMAVVVLTLGAAVLLVRRQTRAV